MYALKLMLLQCHCAIFLLQWSNLFLKLTQKKHFVLIFWIRQFFYCIPCPWKHMNRYLHRLHDELFNCEQNCKIAAKMAAKIILFKLFNIGNSSIVLLTHESFGIDKKIAGLPRIQAAIYDLCIFLNGWKDRGKDGSHTNFVLISRSCKLFLYNPDPWKRRSKHHKCRSNWCTG